MRRTAAAVTALAAMMVMAACSSGGSAAGSAAAPADPAKVSGDITVLTNRTDLQQDGTLAKYAAAFTKLYPQVHVKFQALTDYEGETKIRMNTSNYGDVLLIPNAVSRSDYPKFFAPLGSFADLSKKYQFVDTSSVDGKTYGLVSFASATGFVYNKKVWQQAGITAWPTSTDQMLADLKAVKGKTGAIPYYTNYKDGWPLTQWSNSIGSATCNPGANDLLTTTDPWAQGADYNLADSLLFNVVHDKLSEPDPTTTNWENSKSLLATGKISSMWLGSWAIPQMQAAATKAGQDPSEIGFMPFPAQVGGKSCSVENPDYQYAVSIHSAHKAAARAWIDWVVNESGFAQDNSGISSILGAPLPSALKDFETNNVQMIIERQDLAKQVNDIDKASEVGITAPDYRQHLVDVARGAAPGSLASVLADLSKKWSTGQETAGS
ncbi:ABC transporter substrate-binding protein [Streptacidiphilus cavernicola]|uniref:Extracellular solute-binding protein n=1 Tax=Streptacidiphilus cavernicola TaxID=3342716 RepID=A0ABV6VN95_9ACTN